LQQHNITEHIRTDKIITTTTEEEKFAAVAAVFFE